MSQTMTPLALRLIEADLRQQLADLPEVWQQRLRQDDVNPLLVKLSDFLQGRLDHGAIVYPPDPFKALRYLTPDKIRVVILGQDPYHGPHQAQGLAFSVPDHLRCPPSLRNIFKEIQRDFVQSASTNDLTRWMHQGVLLLNTILTVEEGSPASHAKRGWESVTDAVIALTAADTSPKVFMLWGANAQSKAALIDKYPQHLVLKANHPSPLSALRPPVPFIGCGHFTRANAWLSQHGVDPIVW